MKHIYGPIPSRRLGKSLGVSPVIKKACNYSCVYCMLGKTDPMTNERKVFFPVEEIIAEFKQFLESKIAFDVVSIVGEGEPTLYKDLGKLILEIKNLTDKPVAVITNGGKLFEKDVLDDLLNCDILLPSIDAFDEASFRRINRPHKDLVFAKVMQGLSDFSSQFKGEIWLEIMLVKGYNDSVKALEGFKNILKKISYDRLYINSPVRPPTIMKAKMADKETIELFSNELMGISIELMSENDFYSDIDDDYQAVLSIIKRHPMNQHELLQFLNKRQNHDIESIFKKLETNEELETVEYKGYKTYRYY